MTRGGGFGARRRAAREGPRRAPRRARRAGRALRLWLAVLVPLVVPFALQAQEIRAARYADPTARYDHGVLGDALEWGTLELRLAGGVTRRFTLPETLVFEDLSPRLADLDGDGAPEVIVVETSLTRGARLAVWGPGGRIAATPHIGQSRRWLAPLGAADLDGDGRIEIAYVDRPHLARQLRIWRYEAGGLSPVAQAEDVSNHRIGWDRIPGGIRSCPGRLPEMILADGSWTRVLALRLSPEARVSRRSLGAYTGPDSLEAALRCD